MSKLAVLGGKPVGKVKVPAWPVFGKPEVDNVIKAVKSGKWAYQGPFEKQFEEAFRKFAGAKFGWMVANGTVSIRLGLEALGVGPGDEILVPGLTFQATAAACLDVNAIPVLVDIEPDTLCIDPAAAEAAITSRARAIIPVHLFARIANMDAIMKLARKHKLLVLEDCAHQHGSLWRGKHVGTIGDVGSFSLQGSKVLNAGEGGFVFAKKKSHYELLGSLRNCGRPIREGAPTMQSGNYRATDFQSAVLLGQIERLTQQTELRDENALYMEAQLSEVEGIKTLRRRKAITRQAYYCWAFRYDAPAWGGVPVAKFRQALSAEIGIGCGGTYPPLNNCREYQPHSKKTHKLSAAYWKAIDPKRFRLPASEKACYEEVVIFSQNVLLTNKSGCDMIVGGIAKLRENIDEYVKWGKS